MWLFAPGVFTHQEVSNETDDQDDGEDEKSHAKGYSQDSCPEEETKKSLFLRKLMSVAEPQRQFVVIEADFTWIILGIAKLFQDLALMVNLMTWAYETNYFKWLRAGSCVQMVLVKILHC